MTVYRRITSGFREFLRHESAGGVLLFVAALLAVVFANTHGLAEWREHWLHSDFGIVIGEGGLVKSVGHWINDGLMALFFLLVGLEIKRELVQGELSVPSQAMLPLVAAIGGMVVPAFIYVSFNWGDEAAMRGWAIPVATDIAFSLGVLSLLGSRVPIGLKVFLTAIAVIDDLLAIAIIALFYTAEIDVPSLVYSGVLLCVLFLMNRMRVENAPAYMLAGVVLWVVVLKSGVHATLAGVALAMAIPIRPGQDGRQSLLEQLEHQLLPPVSFVILPVFAFANAGVDFRGLTLGSLAEPIPMGIALGLVLGKMVGIFGASFGFIRSGYAELPNGCSWGMVFAVAMLCGIGFTVSLFIGNLAFGIGEGQINLVKLGVLSGSFVAGVVGYVAVLLATRPKALEEGRRRDAVSAG